jgi:hypothetical protein
MRGDLRGVIGLRAPLRLTGVTSPRRGNVPSVTGFWHRFLPRRGNVPSVTGFLGGAEFAFGGAGSGGLGGVGAVGGELFTGYGLLHGEVPPI